MLNLPDRADAMSRAWRLRRLIGIGVGIPLFIFWFFGLVGLNGVSFLGALFLVAPLLTAMIGGHAILFPKATHETVAISLALTVWAFFGPMAGNSITGWLILLGIFVAILAFGPGLILAHYRKTPVHQISMIAEITTTSSPEAARETFPLRPEQERAGMRCGPKGSDGAFPVWMPEDPAVIPHTPVVDFEDDIFGATLTVGEPTFWAITESDTATSHSLRICDRAADGTLGLRAMVETVFEPRAKGCTVTETEMPGVTPWGETIRVWSTDQQMDRLVHIRDTLERRDTQALRVLPRETLLDFVRLRVAEYRMPDRPKA